MGFDVVARGGLRKRGRGVRERTVEEGHLGRCYCRTIQSIILSDNDFRDTTEISRIYAGVPLGTPAEVCCGGGAPTVVLRAYGTNLENLSQGHYSGHHPRFQDSAR